MAETFDTPQGPYTDSGVGLGTLVDIFKDWQARKIADTNARLDGRPSASPQFERLREAFGIGADTSRQMPMSLPSRQDAPTGTPPNALANNQKLMVRGGGGAPATSAPRSEADLVRRQLEEHATNRMGIARALADQERKYAEERPTGSEVAEVEKFLKERDAIVAPKSDSFLGNLRDAFRSMKGPLYERGKGVNFGGVTEGAQIHRQKLKDDVTEKREALLKDFLRMKGARTDDRTVNDARTAAIQAAELKALGAPDNLLQDFMRIKQQGLLNTFKEREIGQKDEENRIRLAGVNAARAGARQTPAQTHAEWVEYFTKLGEKDPVGAAKAMMLRKDAPEFKFNKDSAEMVMPLAQKMMANVPPNNRDMVMSAFATDLTQMPAAEAMRKLQAVIQTYQR